MGTRVCIRILWNGELVVFIRAKFLRAVASSGKGSKMKTARTLVVIILCCVLLPLACYSQNDNTALRKVSPRQDRISKAARRTRHGLASLREVEIETTPLVLNFPNEIRCSHRCETATSLVVMKYQQVSYTAIRVCSQHGARNTSRT